MRDHGFDYEDVCMGVREKKPATYFRSFWEDYRLRSLVTFLPVLKGTVLDVGCGGGMVSETLLYYYPDVAVYGCDVSKTAISYAKKFGSGTVRYTHLKRKRLPYKDNFFDSCICLDVLEHVPDIDVFLREIKRVLKTRGNFFLIVPCEGEPLTYTWAFGKIRIGEHLTYKYFGHVHPEFTHAYVLALLKKHGFTIASTAYSEHFFYQWMFLLIFFFPKWLLRVFLGEAHAHEYASSSLIRSPKKGTSPLMIVRKLWQVVYDAMMVFPMSFETVLFRHIPLGAWKIHILAKT